jgi:hypothetical protein
LLQDVLQAITAAAAPPPPPPLLLLQGDAVGVVGCALSLLALSSFNSCMSML